MPRRPPAQLRGCALRSMSRDKERSGRESSWTDDDIMTARASAGSARASFNAREVARGCKWRRNGGPEDHPGRSDRSGDGRRDFTFDHCYWSHDRSSANFASQEKVFGDLGRFASAMRSKATTFASSRMVRLAQGNPTRWSAAPRTGASCPAWRLSSSNTSRQRRTTMPTKWSLHD